MSRARDLADLGGSADAGTVTGDNLIINGDMAVAQRGTSSTSSGFLIDRFNVQNVSDGAFSATQDTSAPVGFKNSLKITITTADTSLSSVQNLRCEYRVEGRDMGHLEWGSSDAKTVTLSFWVRSSLTGTFGGAINNNAFNRAYPFTYSISSANTWEYKTITIDGDTSGTWLTDTSIGANICWSLGAGSSRVGTAGAWAGVNVQGVTGQVEVIGTLNATWQITGVKLEVGTTATPFQHESYGENLRKCQRYYYRIQEGNTYQRFGTGQNSSTVSCRLTPSFAVEMRSTPSLDHTGTASNYAVYYNSTVNACTDVPYVSTSQSNSSIAEVLFTATGLTSGGASSALANNNTTVYLAYNAEL